MSEKQAKRILSKIVRLDSPRVLGLRSEGYSYLGIIEEMVDSNHLAITLSGSTVIVNSDNGEIVYSPPENSDG